ncbi:MAG: chemotaxis protein CheX [Candidatus Hydrogenedentes bacterium]|nr:chemotaxis protein CheX [Candidatus Hydrogenedentota bacterium]
MGSPLKIELISPFIEATKETFSTMVSMDLRRKEVFIKQGFDMYGDTSGIIGLSGTTTGTCALSLPADLAQDSVRAMLMTPDDEILSESETRDGVGELINMIAGGAKTKLSSTQYKFNITLPTIISGGKHEVFHRSSAHCVVVVFENINNKTFALDICVSVK